MTVYIIGGIIVVMYLSGILFGKLKRPSSFGNSNDKKNNRDNNKNIDILVNDYAMHSPPVPECLFDTLVQIARASAVLCQLDGQQEDWACWSRCAQRRAPFLPSPRSTR
jgi:hypothetical protein